MSVCLHASYSQTNYRGIFLIKGGFFVKITPFYLFCICVCEVMVGGQKINKSTCVINNLGFQI